MMSSQGNSEQDSAAAGEWAEGWDLRARKGQRSECSHGPGHGDTEETQPSQSPVHSRCGHFPGFQMREGKGERQGPSPGRACKSERGEQEAVSGDADLGQGLAERS